MGGRLSLIHIFVEMKNGVQKASQKKMFPGYVLIHMIMNDDTWYVVRNTRGVTGFVGPGSKPVPLTDAEMASLGIRRENIVVDFAVGDTIKVVSGAWADTIGAIQSINMQKQSLTINVELFGREDVYKRQTPYRLEMQAKVKAEDKRDL